MLQPIIYLKLIYKIFYEEKQEQLLYALKRVRSLYCNLILSIIRADILITYKGLPLL